MAEDTEAQETVAGLMDSSLVKQGTHCLTLRVNSGA